MARLPRLDLPGMPQHIVQRGNNRLPCFLDDSDRMRYLHLLRCALHASDCQLHAHVLIDNHVHLLATPPEAGRIGQLMQRLVVTMWPSSRPSRPYRRVLGRALQVMPLDSADMCCTAIATSNSTRYALVSSTIRPRIAGLVAQPISGSENTRH